VDAWALEAVPKQQPERALELYAGTFLPADEVNGWAGRYRDRLRANFVRASAAVGDGLRARGDLRGAIALYERCLEAEPRSEELARRLLTCRREAGLSG
jgi:DNA-binding SARP family transcriptional activator